MRVPVRNLASGTLLLAVSIAYCLPRHPSAGRHAVLDALLHGGVFALAGLWFGRAPERDRRVLALLALLAALLEVVQWRAGGYASIEYADIASNEAGLLLGWWLARRFGRRAAVTPD